MDRQSVVKYWIDTAEKDYQTAQHLFQSGDYHWGLFVGHLVLEKLLKAIYTSKSESNPPRIHDLVRLAEKCDLKLDEEMLDKLDMISRFNMNVRYPDYQQEIYQICTKDFSLEVMNSIKEIRQWLLNLIQQ